MKGIKLCGECGNYDYKKHRCRIGCKDDSNAQASFYGDCPLPDVVPKSEVENSIPIDVHEALKQRAKAEVAREIFAEIEEAKERWEAIYSSDHFGYGGGAYGYLETDVDHTIYELKKKYTESEGEDER